MTHLSNWAMRQLVFEFAKVLIKLKLSGNNIRFEVVSNFIRRHKSQYDTSSITTPSFWD